MEARVGWDAVEQCVEPDERRGKDRRRSQVNAVFA
jgi:hypothetical protein